MVMTPTFIYAIPVKGRQVLVNLEQVQEFYYDNESKKLQIRFPSGARHEIEGDQAEGIWRQLFDRYGDWKKKDGTP